MFDALAKKIRNCLIDFPLSEQISSKTEQAQKFIGLALRKAKFEDMTQAKTFFSGLESGLKAWCDCNQISIGGVNSGEEAYISLCQDRLRKFTLYLEEYISQRDHLLKQFIFYVPEDLRTAEEKFLDLAEQTSRSWSAQGEDPVAELAYEFALEDSRNHLRTYKLIETILQEYTGRRGSPTEAPRDRKRRQLYYLRCLRELENFKDDPIFYSNVQYGWASDYYHRMLEMAIKDEMQSEILELMANYRARKLSLHKKLYLARNLYREYNTRGWNRRLQEYIISAESPKEGQENDSEDASIHTREEHWLNSTIHERKNYSEIQTNPLLELVQSSL